MPELFALLLKINVALVLFCLGYYLVLRKLTFYTLNRVYLVAAIVLSSAYPLIDVTAFAQKHQAIVAPVQNVVIIWKAPADNLIKQAAYWNWLETLFWAGVILLSLRLMSQLYSLYSIYLKSVSQEINGQKVRVVNADISPFSFWQSIFVNPQKLNDADLKNILEHEQVHVKEWHTLDILLSEMSVILYWFNPGVWMMKRAIRENIEFITDRKILQQGIDSRTYQYSLLNLSFNHHAPAALTSNFNFSTLKKRIKMMNAKRSSKINLTRYALLVPVVTVSLLTFSLSKAEAVKNNPVVKSITAATKNTLSKLDEAISLPADTVPTRKTTNKTVTVITDGKDSANEIIKIVNGEKVVDVINIKADTSKKITYYRNLGFFKGDGVTQIFKDTSGTKLTYVSGFEFDNKTGNTRKRIDTIKTIMINGKKASPEQVAKVIENMSHTQTTTVSTITVNGNPVRISNLTSTYKGNNNEVVVTGRPLTFENSYKMSDSAKNVNVFRITKNTDSVGKVTSLKGRTLPQNTNNNEIVVKGYGVRSSVLPLTETIYPGNSTNFNGKLIIINGKIATENEVKKLSVSDIDETLSLPGKTAVKYYGDQAKNGAVVITTKK